MRRAMTLTYTRSEDKVVVGDKSGDVYSYSTVQPQEAGDLLMGHLSMLLHLVGCNLHSYIPWFASSNIVNISSIIRYLTIFNEGSSC